MAYSFNDDDKAEREFKERVPFGISVVQLLGVTAGETDAGKDFIEVAFTTADGIEDVARVWFVGKAAPISFNTLRSIVVHSAKTDSDKEAARLAVESCADNDELANLMNAKCIGAELWVTKYYDPTRTYQGGDGVERRSINTNIYGYEPKLRPDLMPQADQEKDELNKTFPGSESASAEATAAIPNDWSTPAGGATPKAKP